MSETEIANVATYSDYFPDLPVADNDNREGGWISLGGYIDPPPAPEGFVTEVKREPHLGIVTDYRYVRPALHQITGNGPGVVGADNCQICGRWYNEPETETCKDRPVAPAGLTTINPADAFRNMFAILHNVAMWDLEETGVIKKGDEAKWKRFNNDLTTFVLKLDDPKLDALYALVQARQPERYREGRG